MKKRKTAVADCVRLHILSAPRSNADVVCKVRYLTELLITEERPGDDYYKVCTVSGAEGYCEKSLVRIRK